MLGALIVIIGMFIMCFLIHDMVSFGKYRIVEITDDNGDAYFKVQELSLLGYKDITDNDFPCAFTLTFKTREKAIHFVNSLKRKSKIIDSNTNI